MNNKGSNKLERYKEKLETLRGEIENGLNGSGTLKKIGISNVLGHLEILMEDCDDFEAAFENIGEYIDSQRKKHEGELEERRGVQSIATIGGESLLGVYNDYDKGVMSGIDIARRVYREVENGK